VTPDLPHAPDVLLRHTYSICGVPCSGGGTHRRSPSVTAWRCQTRHRAAGSAGGRPNSGYSELWVQLGTLLPCGIEDVGIRIPNYDLALQKA